jgi:hypothetical protein
MPRRTVLAFVLVALAAAGCSAGFSRPRAQSLVSGDGVMYALIDPDPNRNTDTTIAPLQTTTDGREWSAVVGDRSLPTSVGIDLNKAGVAQQCEEATGVCFRVISPDGGIALDESTDGGQSWQPVWSITAGRIDFQNRCCGSRTFAIRDLEYDSGTGLVAVALGEYGLLTRTADGFTRVDPLGRPDRPESGLMVGLFVEPLFAAVLALAIGWITTEQQLSRVRHELEKKFGSNDHTWLTRRARQVPILLPLVFFVGLGGVIAVAWRITQAAEGDPPEASGWVALGVSLVFIAAVSAAGRLIHRQNWTAEPETASRAFFEPARRKASRAHTSGTVSAVLSYIALLTPAVLWTTGAIDAFADAAKIAVGGAAVIAAAFWIWEATTPPLPD